MLWGTLWQTCGSQHFPIFLYPSPSQRKGIRQKGNRLLHVQVIQIFKLFERGRSFWADFVLIGLWMRPFEETSPVTSTTLAGWVSIFLLFFVSDPFQHWRQPNSFAKIVSRERSLASTSTSALSKSVIIFAKQDIEANEEITWLLFFLYILPRVIQKNLLQLQLHAAARRHQNSVSLRGCNLQKISQLNISTSTVGRHLGDHIQSD